MNKTIISIAAMLCFTGLISWYMYLQNVRFTVVGTETDIVYEIDRKTGDSWTIYRNKRIKNIDDNQGREKYQALPIEQKIKVKKVKAKSKPKDVSFEQMLGLSDHELSGILYNGSSWTIKKVIITVKAIEKGGSIRWNRQFRAFTTIQSLTTGTFTIGIYDDSDISSFDWDLIRVEGIPSK